MPVAARLLRPLWGLLCQADGPSLCRLLFQGETNAKIVNGPSENGEHAAVAAAAATTTATAATSGEEGATLVNGVS